MNFMKKLDIEVFSVLLISNAAYTLFTYYTLKQGVVIEEFELISLVAALIIFVIFLRDKKYKLKYYILYILCNIVLNSAAKAFFKIAVMDFQYSFNAIDKFGTVLAIVGLIQAFSSAWLYGYFKHKSYKALGVK